MSVCPKCGSKFLVDVTNPESIVTEMLAACYSKLAELEADKMFSPEKKVLYTQKWRRIINDTLEVANKMKVGKSEKFDLAQEMMELARRSGLVPKGTLLRMSREFKRYRRTKRLKEPWIDDPLDPEGEYDLGEYK